MTVLDIAQLATVAPGSHVSWMVQDDDMFDAVADALRDNGVAAGEKVFRFGPAADGVIDPRVAFLNSGPLDPDAMFNAFREQTTIARAEGHTGLRVIADMDWLLPADPTEDDVVGFELQLDRVIRELEATVICAYRNGIFADNVAVHPLVAGAHDPQFRFTAAGRGAWSLTGEIDVGVKRPFEAALKGATRSSCSIDVGGLRFIDVAGMRILAGECARASVALEGVSSSLRRYWTLASLDRIFPLPN